MGPSEGGLAAYLDAGELETPRRFYFDSYMGEDYVAALMACCFRAEDISSFQPSDYFITGKELIERWGKLPGIQPEPFIRAKISESRLIDLHPTLGGTREDTEDQALPPLQAGLFSLSDVEAIEEQDFGLREEAPDARRQRLQSWYDQELKLRGERGALTRTAQREKITRQTLSQILRRQK